MADGPTREPAGETRRGHGNRLHGASFRERILVATTRGEVEAILKEARTAKHSTAKTISRCQRAAALRIEQLNSLAASMSWSPGATARSGKRTS